MLTATCLSRTRFVLFCLATAQVLHAEGGEDLDVYKVRMQGSSWFSNPTGVIQGKADSGSFDLSRDFGFGSYSRFSGRLDWRFKRKHHLILGINPVTSFRTRIIGRTIEFQGVTLGCGSTNFVRNRYMVILPGYQYDLIRRIVERHSWRKLAKSDV